MPSFSFIRLRIAIEHVMDTIVRYRLLLRDPVVLSFHISFQGITERGFEFASFQKTPLRPGIESFSQTSIMDSDVNLDY
jgi:hypothetical protein